MKTILFCAYRDWARDVYWHFALFNFRMMERFKVLLAKDPEEMDSILKEHKVDTIVLVGWSWILPKEVCEKYLVVGVHPSDLPEYAGGSPIQHQIIDGLEKTKCTLFQITSEIDGGGIYSKVDMSLEGSLGHVLREVTWASVELLEKFFADEDPKFVKQERGEVRKRLKPEDSNMSKLISPNGTTKQIYDFIRCREDPYPVAYIEDEKGRLEFHGVRYKPHGQD